MRQHPTELELETDPATIRKLVQGAVCGVLILCTAVGGALYLTARAKTNSENAMANVVSPQASMLSFMTGGRINAQEYDRSMTEVCESIAAITQQIGEASGRSSAGSMNCGDIIARTPQDMARIFKDVDGRMNFPRR